MVESSWIALAGQGYKALEDMLPPGMNNLNFPHSRFLCKSGKEVKPEKGSDLENSIVTTEWNYPQGWQGVVWSKGNWKYGAGV